MKLTVTNTSGHYISFNTYLSNYESNKFMYPIGNRFYCVINQVLNMTYSNLKIIDLEYFSQNF